MPREPILGNEPPDDDEEKSRRKDGPPRRNDRSSDEEDGQLRPQRMDDMIGQREVFQRLRIAIDAAKKRG